MRSFRYAIAATLSLSASAAHAETWYLARPETYSCVSLHEYNEGGFMQTPDDLAEVLRREGGTIVPGTLVNSPGTVDMYVNFHDGHPVDFVLFTDKAFCNATMRDIARLRQHRAGATSFEDPSDAAIASAR